MYLQCIRCIKHILVMFQVYIKRYRMYQRVSGASNVSSVSNSVLDVSDVYKVYQTGAFVTFYHLMCGLDFVFAIFANNKVCVMNLIIITYFAIFASASFMIG